jgi:hypothetical protein
VLASVSLAAASPPAAAALELDEGPCSLRTRLKESAEGTKTVNGRSLGSMDTIASPSSPRLAAALLQRGDGGAEDEDDLATTAWWWDGGEGVGEVAKRSTRSKKRRAKAKAMATARSRGGGSGSSRGLLSGDDLRFLAVVTFLYRGQEGCMRRPG